MIARRNRESTKQNDFTAAEADKVAVFLNRHKQAFARGMNAAERAKKVDGAGVWAEGTRKYYALSIKMIDYLLSHLYD